jgi:hypothetical protein
VDLSPVDPEQCCSFRYVIENRNSVGAGSVTKFYMAVHRGDHKMPDCGEDLSEITAPPGYTVSYCEGWRTRPLGGSDWVIYQFDPTSGGEIAELSEVFGSLRIRVNDEVRNTLDEDDVVQPFGVRAWASQHPHGDAFCQTGANFDPLLPNVDGFGRPIWGDAADGLCTNENGNPLRPIPAGTVVGKGLLAMLLVGAGMWLVVRSRTPITG